MAAAWQQHERIEASGCGHDPPHVREALKNRYLCFAHVVYLEAVLFALESGVGSRGSAIVLQGDGVKIHDKLDERWRIAPENPQFRSKVLETLVQPGGRIENRWVERRPIPETDVWFETAWARFRSGEVYRT